MNIPAYAAPTLSIGRTYDAVNSKASGDIFQSDQISIKTIHVNNFSFKYSLVQNSKDVNDLLDVSGELSLKIKANLLKVEGAGQYVNESKKEEGTTKLLAVMKCITVTDTIVGNPTPLENTAGMGTHYVKSVTYGAELVASLTFKTSSTSEKENIKGRTEGQLSLSTANVGLKAELQKLSTECAKGSDLEVNYYSTGLPDKLPINIKELTELIENFPSRMKGINAGKGIPVTFELLPVSHIIKGAKSTIQERVAAYELDHLSNCFDDLRSALEPANKYLTNEPEAPNDIVKFLKEATEVNRAVMKAISSLGSTDEKKLLKESMDAYDKALDGMPLIGKFFRTWKNIYKGKPSAHIEADVRKSSVRYPANTVIKDWLVSSQYSHLEGGMNYHDGKLTVPTPGRYYIYAQLYFFSSGRVYIRVNNKDITMIQAPVNNLDFHGTLYAGGVFNLAAGDFITLVPNSNNGAEIYMDTIHSYFGAYLI